MEAEENVFAAFETRRSGTRAAADSDKKEHTHSQMDNKLFVGNLAWETSEDDLKAYFGQFGTVESAEVLRDKFTGRARGFAFVVMATAEDAQKAIENTEGREFQGRPLKVNIARPREDRPPQQRRGGFRPRFGGNAPRGNARASGAHYFKTRPRACRARACAKSGRAGRDAGPSRGAHVHAVDAGPFV